MSPGSLAIVTGAEGATRIRLGVMNNDTVSTRNISSRPSLLSANLLFLVGMLAILLVGGAMQQAHFGWGLLATELMLGALALLWVRLTRLPWRETLRLHAASGRAVALAFVMGVALWLVDSWLGGVTVALMGYDPPVPPGIYPQSVGAAALIFVGMALGAPLGEELFFRGYMQRAYERMRPVVAIVLVAVLFALFHMSLVGLPPRLPIALALGYVAWRSGSLWPGVALHAANNMMSVFLLALVGLRPDVLARLNDMPFAPGGFLAAVVGVVLVVVTVVLFRRNVGRPQPEGAQAQEAPAPDAPGRSRWKAALPLAAALVIYGAVAAGEVVVGRFPELLAVEPLALQATPWSEEDTWQYRLQHPGAETVGAATCTMTPEGQTATLDCTLQHEPFEVRVGNSIWAGGDLRREFTVVYEASNGTLQQMDEAQTFGDMGYTVNARPEGEGLLLHVEGVRVAEGTVEIEAVTLVDKQWPWQLSALPFVAGASYQAALVFPQRHDPALDMSVITLTDSAVVIGGVEPLSVPAGDFMAWRVTVEDETAWYDVEPPHTVLKYDSGPLIWELEGAR